MALDERFYTSSDLESYFVNKDTGLPLANGTVTFYRNDAPNVGKSVYQLSGSPPNYTYTALPNPITLSAVGTIQNNGGDNVVIYYFPFQGTPTASDGTLDLYYVVVKDEDGVEQFTREAWPNITTSNDVNNDTVPSTNQLANSQFTKVFINEGFDTVFTVAGSEKTFPLGPNWDVVLNGTGDVTVSRVAIAGTSHTPTNPPYAIDILMGSGVSSCKIRQRLNVNSGLWASSSTQDFYLSAIAYAINMSAGSTQVEIVYQESNGNAAEVIATGAVTNSAYTPISGSVLIPDSNDGDEGTDGYVDIYITIQPNAHIRLTSIQVVPVPSDAGADIVAYQQQSSNRDQALMGDWYIPRLNAKPIKSLLVGWDFPLNPSQFYTSGTTITMPLQASAAYVWDQTICGSFAATVAVTRNTVTGGMQFITAAAKESFYMLQYLTGYQAKKILGTRLSSNVFAYTTTTGQSVLCRVYLYRATSGASVPTLPTTIGTVALNGVFTLTGGNNWAEIPRSNLDTAKASLNIVTTNTGIANGNDYGFNGWEITDDTQLGDTDKFAIVVTIATDVAAAATIIVNSVSVVPGDIPTRPAPQTNDEVLRDCMYYYEKSTDLGVVPTTVTTNGQLLSKQWTVKDGGNIVFYTQAFGLQYDIPKRIAANVTLYSPNNGAANYVYATTYSGGAVANGGNLPTTLWGTDGNGQYGKSYHILSDSQLISTPGASDRVDGFITYHFVADARLGMV